MDIHNLNKAKYHGSPVLIPCPPCCYHYAEKYEIQFYRISPFLLYYCLDGLLPTCESTMIGIMIGTMIGTNDWQFNYWKR